MSATDLPPADDYEGILQNGVQNMIFRVDESGLYFEHMGKKVYPHPLSVLEIQQQNVKAVIQWLIQEQNK